MTSHQGAERCTKDFAGYGSSAMVLGMSGKGSQCNAPCGTKTKTKRDRDSQE